MAVSGLANTATAAAGSGLGGLARLDAARAAVLRRTMPVSSVLAARRELRVTIIATLSIAVAFALAAAIPLWTLALGPILFGVPHLLADVRYCIVRPGWHRRGALVVAVGVPLLAGAILVDAQVAMAAVAGAAAASNGSLRRRAAVLVVAVAAIGLFAAWPRPSQLVLLHVHNLVAIALWWAWRRRGSWWHAIPVALFVALSLTLWWVAPVPELSDSAPERLGLARHLAQLAPGLPPATAVRLVVLFCFAQAVHYAVWLRMVPEDDRDRPTPRSFGQTVRALRRELGRPVLVVAAASALFFAAWAVVDLAHARASYLRFGMFHVTLELAAAALLFIEGRPHQTRAQRS